MEGYYQQGPDAEFAQRSWGMVGAKVRNALANIVPGNLEESGETRFEKAKEFLDFAVKHFPDEIDRIVKHAADPEVAVEEEDIPSIQRAYRNSLPDSETNRAA